MTHPTPDSLGTLDRPALERLVVELSERIAALQARLTDGVRPLRAHNAARTAAAQQLQETIRQILAAHAGPAGIAPKQVEAALATKGYSPMPALRTIRRHMQHVPQDGNTARVAISMIEH